MVGEDRGENGGKRRGRRVSLVSHLPTSDCDDGGCQGWLLLAHLHSHSQSVAEEREIDTS